ncbi:MAG TPA: hypothetical protein VLT32_08725 [Candidatus Sulfomarinibacteraceae bacterium]|nr:hypothetical protein [Candidatus Sulfomarinibacteraceae bacterium]
MILNPAVVALVGSSALICGLALLAAGAGLTVVAGWDPGDSGPRQLARERRSFLVEAVLTMVLGCQLASLFLFVATTEHLHGLFTGAMCAAGTLNASSFGYPTLLLKLQVFGLCGLWVVANRATASAASTGLIRFKYLSLLPLAGGLVAENILQYRYFASLEPDIITSCCASIFSERASGLGAELAAMPAAACRVAFLAGLGTVLGAGALVLLSRRSPEPYAALALPFGVLSMAAVVSWVGPAFYQLPNHHCPFCLLAPDHHYVGYPLYAALAVAVVTGSGSGIVHRLRSIDPLGCIRPAEERRLCVASMIGFAVFALIALWPVAATIYRTGGK